MLNRTILLFFSFLLVGLVFGQTNEHNSGFNTGNPTNTVKQVFDIDFGGGFIYGPAFLGSKDYELSLVPDIKIAYGNNFSASVYEGLRYNFINVDGIQVGVLGKESFERRQNGRNFFKVIGKNTKALIGLGNVSSSFELGLYGSYKIDAYETKLELLQGVTGKNELIGNISVARSQDIHELLNLKYPLILNTGLSSSFANSKYTNEYFGVNALQSLRSGLNQYTGKSGFISYGLDNNFILPINRSLVLINSIGYDRLIGSASQSSLVRQRGSKNQLHVAFFLVYKFENFYNCSKR